MLTINETNLHKVFRDFYTVTNMRVVLFSKDCEPLAQYPAVCHYFCDLICQDPQWSKRCDICDRAKVAVCSREEKTIKYFCHLGLWECIVPIYDTHGILGYVMFGQVMTDSTAEETKQRLLALFSEESFPGITSAIDRIPVKSTLQLEAYITVLQALAAYILSNQWVTPQKSEFIRHMEMYIEQNLDKNISVNDICNEFHIRRTRLYRMAKDYFGCSIATYIRTQRIHHACRLLLETDASVSRIAYQVGFCDYGHFSRTFRQIMGTTATQYRRSHQG